MIFNIVANAVIQNWEIHIEASDEDGDSDTQFYADDGILHGSDPQIIQWAIYIMSEDFA